MVSAGCLSFSRSAPDQGSMNEQDASGMQSALISGLRSAREFFRVWNKEAKREKTERIVNFPALRDEKHKKDLQLELQEKKSGAHQLACEVTLITLSPSTFPRESLHMAFPPRTHSDRVSHAKVTSTSGISLLITDAINYPTVPESNKNNLNLDSLSNFVPQISFSYMTLSTRLLDLLSRRRTFWWTQLGRLLERACKEFLGFKNCKLLIDFYAEKSIFWHPKCNTKLIKTQA